MKNLKIEIENYKSIENKVVEFEKLNLISASNGSGKSSLLHAFLLSVFNKSEYKLEDCINWNTDKKYFKIKTTFESDGKSFIIDYKYELKGKQTTRTLTIDKDSFSNTNAVEKLAEYFDPSIEIASNIISQKESGIVKVKPADRRKYLQKIHNLEFKKELQDIDNEITATTNKINQELNVKIEVLNNKSYNLQEIQDLPFDELVYKKHEAEIETLQKEINLVESVIDDKDKKESLLSTLKNKKISIDTDVKRLNDKTITNKELISTLEDNKLLIEADNEKNINTFDAELFKLKMESESIKLQRTPIFNETKLHEIYTDKLNTENKINNVNKEITLCKSGKCPTCQHEFSTNDITTKESELSSLETTLASLIASYTTELESKKINESLKESINKDVLKKQDITSKIQLVETKLANEKDSLDSKLKLNETKIESLVSENKNTSSRITEIISEVIEVEASILDIETYLVKLDIIDVADKKITVSNITKLIKEYDNIVSVNEHSKKVNIKVLEEKETDLVILEDLNKKKLVEQNNKLELEECKVILQKKLPNFIITKLMESIQDGMNEFIDKVYDKSLNIKIKEKRDSIYITYGKIDKDIYLASGFEQALLNFAYKKSLSKLTKSNILFLDEIDDSADTENSVRLFNLIFENNDYESITCISHNESIKDLFFHENANIIEF